MPLTFFLIDEHNPVWSFIDGVLRTSWHTRWVVTMHARIREIKKVIERGVF
jgi:hypothetical protein